MGVGNFLETCLQGIAVEVYELQRSKQLDEGGFAFPVNVEVEMLALCKKRVLFAGGYGVVRPAEYGDHVWMAQLYAAYKFQMQALVPHVIGETSYGGRILTQVCG